MPRARWKPGFAERAYDMMVFAGFRPVPWQFDFMQRIENHDVEETFQEIAMNNGSIWPTCPGCGLPMLDPTEHDCIADDPT